MNQKYTLLGFLVFLVIFSNKLLSGAHITSDNSPRSTTLFDFNLNEGIKAKPTEPPLTLYVSSTCPFCTEPLKFLNSLVKDKNLSFNPLEYITIVFVDKVPEEEKVLYT